MQKKTSNVAYLILEEAKIEICSSSRWIVFFSLFCAAFQRRLPFHKTTISKFLSELSF